MPETTTENAPDLRERLFTLATRWQSISMLACAVELESVLGGTPDRPILERFTATEGAASRTTELGDGITELEEKPAEWVGRVMDLERRSQTEVAKLAQVEQQMVALRNRIGSVEAKLAAFEQRTDARAAHEMADQAVLALYEDVTGDSPEGRESDILAVIRACGAAPTHEEGLELLEEIGWVGGEQGLDAFVARFRNAFGQQVGPGKRRRPAPRPGAP